MEHLFLPEHFPCFLSCAVLCLCLCLKLCLPLVAIIFPKIKYQDKCFLFKWEKEKNNNNIYNKIRYCFVAICC